MANKVYNKGRKVSISYVEAQRLMPNVCAALVKEIGARGVLIDWTYNGNGVLTGKRKPVVHLQKTRAITLEFCPFDSEKQLALFDQTSDLGDLNISDECTKEQLIAKLENVVRRLKKHKGDVFVVQ